MPEYVKQIVEPASRYSVGRPYRVNRLDAMGEFILRLTRWQRQGESPKITERYELLRSATILSADDLIEVIAIDFPPAAHH